MPTTSAELDGSTVDLVRAYQRAQAEIDRWTTVRDELRGLISDALGDTEIGNIDGKPVVRKTVVESTRLDTTKLRESEPDVYERYARPATTVRVTVAKK